MILDDLVIQGGITFVFGSMVRKFTKNPIHYCREHEFSDELRKSIVVKIKWMRIAAGQYS